MSVIHLNENNFDQEVLDFDGIVLVDFWATWCGPCQMQGPIIEELADAYADKTNVKICKLDVDKAMPIAQRYKVISIPTIMIFAGGEIKDKKMGLTQYEELEDMLGVG